MLLYFRTTIQLEIETPKDLAKVFTLTVGTLCTVHAGHFFMRHGHAWSRVGSISFDVMEHWVYSVKYALVLARCLGAVRVQKNTTSVARELNRLIPFLQREDWPAAAGEAIPVKTDAVQWARVFGNLTQMSMNSSQSLSTLYR